MTPTSYNSLYGITFNPFRPDIPHSALIVPPNVDTFCRRVEFSLADGGFALVTGDPGTGKSVALRILAQRLGKQRDVVLGTVDHPQSGVAESFFASLKKELVRNVAYLTRASARADVFEYIEVFYNRERIHTFLGNQSPSTFESCITQTLAA